MKGLQDIGDHVLGTGLGFRWKIGIHVQLANRLANGLVQDTQHPLFPGPHGLQAPKSFAEEVKIRLTHLRAQVGSCPVEDGPTEVILPGFYLVLPKDLIETLEVGRLTNDNGLQSIQAEWLEICFPIKLGDQLGQLGHGHGMIPAVGIPAFLLGHQTFRHPGLQREDASGGSFGAILILTQETEHSGNVPLVILSQGYRSGVLLGVVIPFRQSQVSGTYLNGIHGTVLQVGTDTEIHEWSGPCPFQLDQYPGQVIPVADLVHPGEDILDGPEAIGIDLLNGHPSLEEKSRFPLVRIAGIGT